MPIPAGWIIRPTKEFATHAGPFYAPADNAHGPCGFLAEAKHGNKRGVVHGGMLATAFDVALGNASWEAAGQKPSATVSLNIQYIGAVQLGDFALITPEVMKTTRSLVFIRGHMTVDGKTVAVADGVWKILAWRGEAFKPE